MTWPEMTELRINPASNGRIWYPDSVGLDPRTTWNQRGTKMIAPKKPKPARKTASSETLIDRFRKRLSGRIGSEARDSTHTKTADSASPSRMRPPTCGFVQSIDCLL